MLMTFIHLYCFYNFHYLNLFEDFNDLDVASFEIMIDHPLYQKIKYVFLLTIVSFVCLN